jgi:hypothetical protein
MKNLIVVVIVVALIGYVVSQWARIYKARTDLDQVVAEQLNFVDENSQPAVKQKLVEEARKLGIELSPDDIRIAYVDTNERTVAENFTAKIATFVNKRVTIQLGYTARLVVIPLHEQIEESRIRQIQAQQRERPEMQQFLDATPQ